MLLSQDNQDDTSTFPPNPPPSPPSEAPRRGARVKNRLIRMAVWTGLAAYRRVLWPLADRLVPLLAALAWLLARRERRLAMAQLVRYLGLTPDESRDTAKALCRHLARALLECLELARQPQVIQDRVRFTEGSEARLRDALAAGRGAVFATAHLGNWEWMAAFLAARFKIATVVAGSYDPKLAAWIDGFRRAYGIVTVHRDEPEVSARLGDLLKQGYIVAVLIDQNTRVPSVMARFFGEAAPTPRGAAALARRWHAPFLVGYTARVGDTHEVTITGPLSVPEEATDPVLALTEAANAHLETAIRLHPEQWVWFHRRW